MWDKNIGTLVRLLRLTAGGTLIAWALLGGPARAGVVSALTAFIGFCSAYLPFGLSSCRR